MYRHKNRKWLRFNVSDTKSARCKELSKKIKRGVRKRRREKQKTTAFLCDSQFSLRYNLYRNRILFGFFTFSPQNHHLPHPFKSTRNNLIKINPTRQTSRIKLHRVDTGWLVGIHQNRDLAGRRRSVSRGWPRGFRR